MNEDEKQAAELRQAADALLGDKSVVDIDLEDISERLEDEGRDVPVADIEILAECPVLWSGWECDRSVLLYRIRSTGETGLHVVSGVAFPGDRGPVAMLEERLADYRNAIEETQAFIARVRREMPDETA